VLVLSLVQYGILRRFEYDLHPPVVVVLVVVVVVVEGKGRGRRRR